MALADLEFLAGCGLAARSLRLDLARLPAALLPAARQAAPGAEDPARGQPADQPAEVVDPAHARSARDGYGQDVGVGQGHDHRGQRVDHVPVDQPAGQDVAEVAEDQAAGPDGESVALEQPDRQAAGDGHDQGHTEELDHAAVGGEQAEHEQRPGVALDVIPGEVQERGGEDVAQVPEAARHDAVAAVEVVVVGPVRDLQDPDQHDEPDHQEEGLPGLVDVDLGRAAAVAAGPGRRSRSEVSGAGLVRHASIVDQLSCAAAGPVVRFRWLDTAGRALDSGADLRARAFERTYIG